MFTIRYLVQVEEIPLKKTYSRGRRNKPPLWPFIERGKVFKFMKFILFLEQFSRLALLLNHLTSVNFMKL
jgi:hypothetical protein